MSGGAGGVCKGHVVSERVREGLCPKDTGEPWEVLSKGEGVSRSSVGRPLWLLWGGFEAGVGGIRREQMRHPGGRGLRMGRNERLQRIFSRGQGQDFPPFLECSN